MEHYGISINGITVLSARKVAICEPSQCPNWMASVQEADRSIKLELEQEEGLIRASKLMINAAYFHQRIAYPLKQGNCVIKLIDQAIFELRYLKANTVSFPHARIIKKVFYVEDDDEYKSTSLVDIGYLVDDGPAYREWRVSECIEILLRCKYQVLLEQICFIVYRIQMTAFVGEVKANRYLGTANKSRSDIVSKQLVEVSCEGNELRVPEFTNKPSLSKASLDPSGLSAKSRQQLLYSGLRKNFYGDQQPDNKPRESRMCTQGNYTLMWNATNKEYHTVLLSSYKGSYDGIDTSFVGGLNTRLKYLEYCKEDNSLRSSLRENYLPVGAILACSFLGLLILCLAEDDSDILVCLALCLGGVVWTYLHVLSQEIFSLDSFKAAIKQELQKHFERSQSNYIYEMQPEKFDISVIKKL